MKIHVLVMLTSLLASPGVALTSSFTSSASQQNPNTPVTDPVCRVGGG